MTDFLTTKELDAAAYALPYPKLMTKSSAETDEDKRPLAERRAQYRADTKALEARWEAWLADEYASEFSKVTQDEIFRRAWDDGHSYGYSAVEDKYSEFAEFAQLIAKDTRATDKTKMF